MKKQYEGLIRIAIWIAIAIFIAQLVFFSSEAVTVSLLYRFASKAVALAAILVTIYERWAWRYNPIEKTPKLHRVYKGKIKSKYDDIEREATIEIKQTLLSVDVVLITNESRSNTVSANISEVFGEKQLIYHYLNKPKTEFRHRSEIHFGTAILSLNDTKKLTGDYYTDRNTKGDMEFDAVQL